MLFTSFCLTTVSAQEYKVVSLDVEKTDLTARTNPRVDSNGRKCAVLKVYVDDQIAEARGSVVGNIEAVGMEKQIYMAHDAKQVELVFQNHYPLKIVFIDYDIPSLTGQMTYICKLKTDNTKNASTALPNSVIDTSVAASNLGNSKTVQPFNMRIHVVDSKTKEPLIGATVLKNPKYKEYNFDNWENRYDYFTCEEGKATDLDGNTGVFKDLTVIDKIECQYAGYKSKSVNVMPTEAKHSQVMTIELTEYNPNQDYDILIHVGFKEWNKNGWDGKGAITITNSRTQEQFTMSNKANENDRHLNVRYGDKLLFTKSGYKLVSVEFKYHVPESIKISPLKGKSSDIQYLVF